MTRLVAWACGIGVLAAGVVLMVILAGSGRVGGGGTLTNDLDVRMPARGVVRRTTVWTEAVRLGEPFGSGLHEFDPTTDARGTVMIFSRGRTGGGVDLYESRWDGVQWTTPEAVDALNSEADDLGAALSADGRRVIFSSDRVGEGGFDLWVSARGDAGWDEPRLLAGANSHFDEYDPAISPDGRTVLFASNRPRGDEDGATPDAWSATIRERGAQRDFDLYALSLEEDAAGELRRLDGLNTSFDEGTPAFSPRGDFVYFASDREGAGGFDLYRARVTAEGIGDAEGLGAPVNTAANEMDPALMGEGYALVFSSDRGGELIQGSGGARFGLYASVSREVYEAREPFDWAGLWSMVWPWLLALLLLLLLLYLLRLLGRLARDPRWSRAWRRLSLLAKCILLSMLVHALLLMLLAAWQVKAALEEYFRDESGGVRVVIAGESGGSEAFFDQVRGGVERESVEAAISDAAAVTDAVMEEVVFEAVIPERMAIEAPAVEAVMETRRAEIEFERPESAAARVGAMDLAVETPSVERVAAREEAREVHVDVAMPGRAVATGAPSVARAVDDDVERASLEVRAGAEPTRLEVEAGRGESGAVDVVLAMPAARLVDSGVTDGVAIPRAERTATVSEEGHEGAVARDAMALDAGVAAPPGMAAMADERVERAAISARADDAEVMEVAPVALGGGGTVGVAESMPTAGGGMLAVELPTAEGVPVAEETDGDAAGGERFASAVRSGVDAPAMDAVEVGDVERAGAADIRGVVEARMEVSGLSVMAGIETEALGARMPDVAVRIEGLSLPVATDAEEDVYPQRAPGARERLVEEGGGSAETEEAVARALDWLARHQHEDGRWSSRGFDDGCGECGGGARYEFDAATTGLALLCFFGADHGGTDRETEYSGAVRRGVAWLRSRQGDDGDLRDGGTMYTHGIATIALCEAYAMSRDEALLGAIRRAVRFIEDARSTGGGGGGGWRYEPGQAGDTSVLGWQVMALESARRCGVEIDAAALEGARAWLDAVSTRRARGRYAYQRGMAPTMSMTAEGMFVQQLLGADRDEARMGESARFVVRETPDWDADANTYGWYYATLALYQHGGREWERWNAALVRELLGAQRDDGAAAGSFDPADQWSNIGGRVYQTALCTLSLEVYYRYLPMYVGDAD